MTPSLKDKAEKSEEGKDRPGPAVPRIQRQLGEKTNKPVGQNGRVDREGRVTPERK